MRPGETVGEFSSSSEADAAAAVAAAEAAFAGWAALPMARRAAYLTAAAAVLEARVEQIARRHEHRDGQAAARGARRGRTRRADPALRRERGLPLGRRALRAGGHGRAGVDAAQARRRHRADHAVELPDRDSDLEARARADLRQHRRPQARVRGAAHRPAHRRGVRGGGAAAGRAQRPHRPRLDRRRRARAGHARARDLLHRLRRDRPLRARRRDAARQARPARARRAQPAARARGRRHRPRGRGDVRRRVLVGGPEVHGDATHLRPGRGLRHVQDRAARAHRARQGRRPARSRRRGRPDREREAVRRDHGRDRARESRGRHRAHGRRARRRRRVRDRADRVRGRARRRVPLVRGGLRPGDVALSLLDARRGDGARERDRVRALRGDLHVEPRRGDPLPERGTGRAPARQLADRRRRRARARSAASSRAASARTSRAAPRSSSTPRPSPSTSILESERFLVTGALGCIGAWSCALLAEEGVDVVGFDYGTDDRRLRLATDAEIPLVQGDIVDGKALRAPARRARDHARHPSRRAAPAADQARPAVRHGREHRRHRQRPRRGEDARHPGRVCELGGGVLDRQTTRAAPCRTTRSGIPSRSTACTSRRARAWRESSGTRNRCRRSASGPSSSTARDATTGSPRRRRSRWQPPRPGRTTG